MDRIGHLGRMAGAAAASLWLLAATADAAEWHWGCAGALGDKRIVFNRTRLVVIAGKGEVARKLDDLVRSDDLTSALPSRAEKPDAIEGFQADDQNSGFEARMSFTADADDRKLVLVEVASRRTGRTAKLVHGCRDETVERFRKTYRIEMGAAPAQTVTLACMEYLLSTRGGRICK